MYCYGFFFFSNYLLCVTAESHKNPPSTRVFTIAQLVISSYLNYSSTSEDGNARFLVFSKSMGCIFKRKIVTKVKSISQKLFGLFNYV